MFIEEGAPPPCRGNTGKEYAGRGGSDGDVRDELLDQFSKKLLVE